MDECKQAIDQVIDISFVAGVITGCIIVFVVGQITAYFLPFLQCYLHDERLKRGIPCDCEECNHHDSGTKS